MREPDVRLVVQAYDLEAMGDEWETLVATGQEIVKAHDRNRWTLGDLGRKVARRYGEQSLRQYAGEIGVRGSTLYDYCRVARFYPPDAREQFQSLSWSHYREAARLAEFEQAMDALEQAEDGRWSVEDLRDVVNALLGKGDTDEEAADAEPAPVADLLVTLQSILPGGVLQFSTRVGSQSYDAVRPLNGGATYRLKVYALEEAP